jgi:hypothetical protein
VKKNSKLFFGIAIGVVVVVAIIIVILKAAGGSVDVVATGSAASFEKILAASDNQVTSDEENADWSLQAPDGTIRFIWSWDYSQSPLYDLMLELDAQPFIKAGLDTSKLTDYYAVEDGMLKVGTKLGSDKLSYEGEATPLAAYEQIARKNRSSIGYHTALDHYNVSLDNGNMFEWAKDMQINSATMEMQDKDIVFVLNPEPLIAAGVDPEKVEGWIYTAVSVGMEGKVQDVYKFLKPYDLG